MNKYRVEEWKPTFEELERLGKEFRALKFREYKPVIDSKPILEYVENTEGENIFEKMIEKNE